MSTAASATRASRGWTHTRSSDNSGNRVGNVRGAGLAPKRRCNQRNGRPHSHHSLMSPRRIVASDLLVPDGTQEALDLASALARAQAEVGDDHPQPAEPPRHVDLQCGARLAARDREIVDTRLTERMGAEQRVAVAERRVPARRDRPPLETVRARQLGGIAVAVILGGAGDLLQGDQRCPDLLDHLRDAGQIAPAIGPVASWMFQVAMRIRSPAVPGAAPGTCGRRAHARACSHDEARADAYARVHVTSFDGAIARRSEAPPRDDGQGGHRGRHRGHGPHVRRGWGGATPRARGSRARPGRACLATGPPRCRG